MPSESIAVESTAPMTMDEVRTLVGLVGDDEAQGQDVAFISSAPDPASAHTHIARIGYAGTGNAARVSVALHDKRGHFVQAVYTAADARKMAATLLDAADDIDGRTPLLWLPAEDDPAEGDSA